MEDAGFFDELHHALGFGGVTAERLLARDGAQLRALLTAATMRSMFSTRAKFGPHSQMQSIDSSATIVSMEPKAFASPTCRERASAAALSALARVGL